MKKTTSLTYLLSKIKDKRRKQGTRHSMENILIVVILSIMNGYNGYHALDDFMKRFENELERVLRFPKHGLPSYSAIRRLLINVDFNIVSQQFNKWTRSKVKILKREWVQADGKGMKGTVVDYDNKYQNFVNLVSLFVDRLGITLNVQQINNKKQSEIGALQRLIAEFELKGVIITADAMHCQKKTTAGIVQSGNDYVLKIKDNQRLLLEEVKRIKQCKQSQGKLTLKEKNRGRKEIRVIQTYLVSELIKQGWCGAKMIVYVKRDRTRKGRQTITHSYYLSSIILKAEEFAKGIRHHWGIENRLHYTKDVTFKEDQSKIRTGNAPAIISLIKNLVIAIIRTNYGDNIAKFIRCNVGCIQYHASLILE